MTRHFADDYIAGRVAAYFLERQPFIDADPRLAAIHACFAYLRKNRRGELTPQVTICLTAAAAVAAGEASSESLAFAAATAGARRMRRPMVAHAIGSACCVATSMWISPHLPTPYGLTLSFLFGVAASLLVHYALR